MKKKKGPSNNVVSQKILADFEQSKNDIDDIGINLKSINKGELLEDETFVKDIFSKKVCVVRIIVYLGVVVVFIVEVRVVSANKCD